MLKSLRRPIDVHRPLKIWKKPGLKCELELEKNNNEEKKTQKSIKENSQTNIPTPQIRYIQNTQNTIQFKKPNEYIKFFLCSGANIVLESDRYDLLEEDIVFLNSIKTPPQTQYKPPSDSHLPQPNPTVQTQYKPPSEEQFIALIELFEKAAFKYMADLDPTFIFPKSMALELAASTNNMSGEYIPSIVYDYWVSKRLKINNTLIRRYNFPPRFEDTSPHIAFRPRKANNRRQSSRNPRKNDNRENYNKMRVLLMDFEKASEICKLIVNREQLKKDNFLLNVESFDERLSNTNYVKILHLKQKNGTSRLSSQEETFLSMIKSPFPQSDFGKDIISASALTKTEKRSKSKSGSLRSKSRPSSYRQRKEYKEWSDRPRPPPIRLGDRNEPFVVSDASSTSSSDESDISDDELQLFSELELRTHYGNDYYLLKENYPDKLNHEIDPWTGEYIPSGFKGRVQTRVGRQGRIWIDRVLSEEVYPTLVNDNKKQKYF